MTDLDKLLSYGTLRFNYRDSAYQLISKPSDTKKILLKLPEIIKILDHIYYWEQVARGVWVNGDNVLIITGLEVTLNGGKVETYNELLEVLCLD